MDAIDKTPQGDPETVVILPHGSLIGLKIRGLYGHVMLGIREDEQGHPVSCAVTDELFIDTHPRRDHGYGYTEDDGA